MTYVKEKFMAKVSLEPMSGCWIWDGVISGTGYGNYYCDGKSFGAHRVSYELFVGPIPQDMCILHKCDVRPCVNPDHLFVGTKKDNSIDMHNKSRAVDNSGSRHGMSKLIEYQVRVIKRLLGSGLLSQKNISDVFNVDSSTISNIKTGRRWRHIA